MLQLCLLESEVKWISDSIEMYRSAFGLIYIPPWISAWNCWDRYTQICLVWASLCDPLFNILFNYLPHSLTSFCHVWLFFFFQYLDNNLNYINYFDSFFFPFSFARRLRCLLYYIVCVCLMIFIFTILILFYYGSLKRGWRSRVWYCG